MKPSNVLLAPPSPLVGEGGWGGEGVKITDFGLARLLDTDTRLTASETLLGTPCYMAPEQAAGQKDVGPAADVYALGAVLYECLTGRPPFRAATSLETLRQVLEEDPVLPSRLQSHVPADLERVCLKGLRKDPRSRYLSAADLADDLRRFLRHEPVRARPASAWERARKWARRRPAAAALVALAGLAVLALLAGGTWHTLTVDAERRKVAQREELVREQSAEVRRQRQRVADRERLVLLHEYVQDLPRALHCWQDGDVAGARALLDRHARATGPDDLRGFAWYYLDRLCRDGEGRTLATHTGGATAVAFSRDGLLASAGPRGTLTVWDRATGRPIDRFRAGGGPVRQVHFTPTGLLLAGPGGEPLATRRGTPARLLSWWTQAGKGAVRVAWSPGGRVVAVLRPGDYLDLFEVRSGRKTASLRVADSGQPIDGLAIADDGRRVVTTRDIVPHVWDAGARSSRGIGRFLKAPAASLAVSGNGRTLALLDVRGALHLFDLDAAAELQTFAETRTGKARCAAFSADGQLLATGSDDHTVRLWKVRQPALLAVFRGHTGPVHQVAFSPDGRSLASAGQDGAVKCWPVDLHQERLALTGALRPAGPLAASHDGKWLAVARSNGPPAVVATATGETRFLGGGPASPVRLLALSPDGRTLAAVAGDQLCLWDVPGGKVRATLSGFSRSAALAFSPDGRWLACAGPGTPTRFWDAASARETMPLAGPPRDVRALAFTADGGTLATSDGSRTARLWDLSTGQPLQNFQETGEIVQVAFSTTGLSLAIAQVNGLVSVRRREKGRWGPPRPHPVGPTMLGFLPGDSRLACASKHLAWLRDLRTPTNKVDFLNPLLGAAHGAGGRALALLRPDGALTVWRPDAARRLVPPGQRLQPLECLAFLPDGKTLVTGGPEPDFIVSREERIWPLPTLKRIGLEAGPCPEIRFWSAASAAEQPTLPDQQTLGASHLACSADGRTLISAGRGGVAWVWDLVGRRLRQRFFVNDAAGRYWTRRWEVGIRTFGIQPVFEESVQALALSPDSRTVAVASGRGAVTLHDLDAPARPERLPDLHHQVRALAFSPDGRTLAVNDGAVVRLWRLPRQAEERPRLVRSLEDHSRVVHSLAFDPTGRLLASAGEDHRVLLWQVESGRHTALPGHTDTVESLAFAPDGRTLASGGVDARVLLWHVPTGNRLLTLAGHTGPVRRVAFSPDGRTLASGGVSASGVGEAYLWQAGP